VLDKAQMRARVEQTVNIATIPQIVSKLRTMFEAPSMSAVAVGEEIAKDQVLALKVLKLVNSGFYGFRTPITTITQAMVLLGFDVVKTLVLSASVLDILELMNQSVAGLWEHSLGTARAASGIAARLNMANPEEIAVAGLLHDLGKVIIAQRFPQEHAQIRETVSRRNCLQIDAEREVLGVTHLDVGMWLLKKWSLPAKLVSPIAFHNNFHPSRDFADRTAVIHLADILARAKGVGYPGDSRLPAIDPAAWHLLHLSFDDLEDICLQLEGDNGSRMIA